MKINFFKNFTCKFTNRWVGGVTKGSRTFITVVLLILFLYLIIGRTLPSSRGISVPPPTPPGVLQVRGVYSHVGEGESKLSFAEGDVINLIGEKSDGWHYGQNTRSGK